MASRKDWRWGGRLLHTSNHGALEAHLPPTQHQVRRAMISGATMNEHHLLRLRTGLDTSRKAVGIARLLFCDDYIHKVQSSPYSRLQKPKAFPGVHVVADPQRRRALASRCKTTTSTWYAIHLHKPPPTPFPGFKPLVRKSSLTFASLPAREPLLAKTVMGNRVSRTSHVGKARNNQIGKYTGGKSLGGS